MRAAVCHAFGQPLAIEEVELDVPGAGEIAVDIAACAICHSDILYADGAWGGALPAVYGHEAAGVVRGLGAGVKGFAPGDHVVVTLIRSCGTCPSCGHGHPVTCEGHFPRESLSPLRGANGERLMHGLKTAAFAERAVVDASQCVVIPKTMSFESASLLACGVITGFGAAINTARIEPGASIAVIGIGGVGLNVVQGAAYAGAAVFQRGAHEADEFRAEGFQPLDPHGRDQPKVMTLRMAAPLRVESIASLIRSSG